MLTPKDANLAVDSEDDDAFAALEDDLSPGEAQRVLDTMRPLSKEEEKILDDLPEIDDLRKVDDAEQEKWLLDKTRDGYRAMDKVLEDSVYGDDMDHEEKLERLGLDTDSGLGFDSYLYPNLTPPSQGDPGLILAWPIEAISDYFTSRRAKSKDREAASKAVDSAISKGLTSGGDFDRSVYLTFGWNTRAGKYGQIGDGIPEVRAVVVKRVRAGDPKAIAFYKAVLKSGYTPTKKDPGLAQLSGDGNVLVGIAGEDSLGAAITEILSGPAPTRAQGTADKMVQAAVTKLRSGNPIQPGELAIIARLAKAGHPGAKALYDNLMRVGTSRVKLSGADESGDWFYKLNPLRYVTKTSEERTFEDKEREGWSKNADLQKQLAKRQEVLTQAEKAAAAQAAVKAAQDQAVATEQQLKAIAASLSGVLVDSAGAFVGSFVGHEKPTTISKVVSSALAKAGKEDRAAELYDKILSKKPLSKEEVSDVREIAKILHREKVVHGDLIDKEESAKEATSAMHGAFVGAALCAGVQAARRKNEICGRAALVLQRKIGTSGTLSGKDARAAVVLDKQTKKLRDLVHAHASGKATGQLDQGAALQKAVIVGAAKAAMTDVEKQQLAAIQKLAAAGNPRATEALNRLKASGAIVGGDVMGFSFGDALKYATAPIWWPAQQLAKGAKWTGQQLGIVSKGSPSPEQVRLNMLRAAAQRRKAAAARAAAADAQTQAELRAQQSIADAADAEAEAADAQALSQEAAMRTKEIEADPEMANIDSSGDTFGDTSGAFVGSWESHVDVLGKKFVKKAAEKSPTGAKIRAGAVVYKKIKAGDPKAKASLKAMIARSQKGDQQATRDLRAIYAGRQAVVARDKAVRKEARIAKRRARNAKVVAVQRRLEAGIANKLVRLERKHDLNKASRVERHAAAGNKRAKSYIAAQMAAAKKGDKKAKKTVANLAIAHKINTAAPTKRERRNLAAASHLYRRAKKNDPKAIRQVQVLQAAANKGNPNAKRAVKRLNTAKDLEMVLALGAVAATTAAAAKKQKNRKKSRAEHQQTLANTKSKLRSGTATREELAEGAQAAHALGDKQGVAVLAKAAAKAPSATLTLQKTAAVVTAKEAGSPEAKAAISESFDAAKSGNPAEIKAMGNVVAAQTLADVQAGRPVPQAMRDAVNLQERVAAKDPVATQEVRQIEAAATMASPPPEATAAAITLAAAAVTSKALAAKPQAKREFLEKVNPPLSPEEAAGAKQKLDAYVASAKAGTITAEEGVAAEKLASRMNQHHTAAVIAAMAPPPPPSTPLTSLPDEPQLPIKGAWNLVKESLKALTFSTRDPLANWREGVSAMSKSAAPAAPATTAGGCDDAMGWSPFPWLKKYLPIILPGITAATATASLATAIAQKNSSTKPAAPAAPAAPVAPAAPAVVAKGLQAKPTAEATSTEGDEPEGPHMTDPVRKIIASAVDSKKMSRQDFNRAVNLYAGPQATAKEKAAVGAKMLGFLQKKKIALDTSSVSGAFVGAEKTFKDFVSEALQQKKMSRRDFNKAVEKQVGSSSTPEKKVAVGQTMLKFLAARGVQVET